MNCDFTVMMGYNGIVGVFYNGMVDGMVDLCYNGMVDLCYNESKICVMMNHRSVL